MRRTFEYRLKPNRAQAEHLKAQLASCQRLYNAMLEQRQRAYRETGRSPTWFEQGRELKDVRTMSEYATINAHVLKDVARRLDLAFKSFFRRVKAGETPGYPRFRSRDRYNSMTWPDVGKNIIKDGRISLSKAPPGIRFIQHRPIRGTIKTVTIKKRAGKWYVLFSCMDVPPDPTLKTSTGEVGVDMGLTTFATLSNGEEIANPRHGKKAEARLRAAQKRLSRCKRGSNRRLKARRILAKHHEHVANQRRDHAFKMARTLVQRYGLIAIEDLQIQDMMQAPRGLVRSIADASWSQFMNILSDKAEEAGSTVVRVDPRDTTQGCSKCGTNVPKTLRDRVHACKACGIVMGRDINAAKNILQRGRCDPSWRPSNERVVETRSSTL